MKKLSFASWSIKIQSVSGKFLWEASKVGGFYTIWSCTVRRSDSRKEPFRFQSNFFFNLSRCRKKIHGNERKKWKRRKKNKHKQKSHKRGTANETNHENERRKRKIIESRKEIKKKTNQPTDIPVKYANVNELICAILLSNSSNHANGQKRKKMINCNWFVFVYCF